MEQGNGVVPVNQALQKAINNVRIDHRRTIVYKGKWIIEYAADNLYSTVKPESGCEDLKTGLKLKFRETKAFIINIIDSTQQHVTTGNDSTEMARTLYKGQSKVSWTIVYKKKHVDYL